MVKILGLPFDSFVDKQIEIRQKRLALLQKTPQDLSVFNSNTAWVRLSSGVKIEPSRAIELSNKLGISQDLVQGTTLARKLVLWGGISSFTTGSNSISLDPIKGGIGYGLNNTYGFLSGPEQGLKPPPGITGITCDYKNNGSLKQATVTMKCYTRSQFEALEAVYLRLGYTMVLEWGNTLWYSNKEKFTQTGTYSVPNMLFKSEQDLIPTDVAQQISNNKKNMSGNYDGMVARVANYSWTLGDDLSFDIKLYLISAGDIIESLKMNVGGTNSEDLANRVEAKEGFQEIAAIIVNKEASKLNAFIYELYDTIIAPAIEQDGSEENKENIVKINDQADAATKLEGIKEKYKTAIEGFMEYYTLFLRGFEIYKGAEVTKGTTNGIRVIPAVDEVEWTEIANKLNYTISELQSLYKDANEENQIAAANNYKSSLDSIVKYFNKVKVGENDGNIDDRSVDVLAGINGAEVSQKEVILTLLDEGEILLPLGARPVKVEGSQFKDSTTFDSRFAILLQNLFPNIDF